MMRNTSAMAYGITTRLLLLLCVAPGMAVAQASAGSPQTPASLPGTAIPVVEVATQATEVSKFLRTLSAQIISSPAIASIHKVLPEVSRTIDLELAATSTMLQGQPSLELLQAQQQLWQRRQLHTTWTATRTAAQRLGQVLLVGETLVGIIVAWWMLSHLRRAPGAVARQSGVVALRLGIWLFLLTFAAGLAASSLGYGRLARLVTSGILAGDTLALTLTASFRVLNGVLAGAHGRADERNEGVWEVRSIQPRLAPLSWVPSSS